MDDIAKASAAAEAKKRDELDRKIMDRAKHIERCTCGHLALEHGRDGICANSLLCLCLGFKMR